MMGLKAKEHLRGHSTQGQAPAMLGSNLGSQLCFLQDMQLFGSYYCHGFERAELYPLSK